MARAGRERRTALLVTAKSLANAVMIVHLDTYLVARAAYRSPPGYAGDLAGASGVSNRCSAPVDTVVVPGPARLLSGGGSAY